MSKKNMYDDDGEVIGGGDISGWSEMVIELVEKPSYEIVGTFDNYSDAEDALNNYEGDCEVYISFS